MKTSLLRAIRTIRRADGDRVRQMLFERFSRKRATARLVQMLHRGLGVSRASTLLVSCYGIVAYVRIADPVRQGRLLTIAVHANSRRHVARVSEWFPRGDVAEVRLGARALFSAGTVKRLVRLLAGGRRLRAAFRVLHSVNQQRNFLVSCRTAAVIGAYTRGAAVLRAHPWSAVVVSSDTNPEEVAFVAAARARNTPTVFVAHTYANPFAPPLDYSLSILEGTAALERRQNLGGVRGRVFLLGLDGDWRPMNATRIARSDPVVGILAPKAVDSAVLADVLRDCRDHVRARAVLIRWHPSAVERMRLDPALTAGLEVASTPPADPLAVMVDRCDWVVADLNSNVHLEVLRRGVPTVAIAGLAAGAEAEDIFGFGASGLVFPPIRSLRDLDRDAFIAFFTDAWVECLRRHDAGYGRPAGDIAASGRRAILEIVARSAT